MIACVSGEAIDRPETRSTLEYASRFAPNLFPQPIYSRRARNIRNKPKINHDPNEGLMARIKRENIELMKEVSRVR
jgi:hypothetical protein